MKDIVLTLGSRAFSAGEVLLYGGGFALFLLTVSVFIALRASRERSLEAAHAAERQREMDDKVAELNRLQAEMTGRMQTMVEVIGSRQADLTKAVADRLDAVRSSIGQGLEHSAQRTVDGLSKLNERLAVIDAAQSNLTNLTSEVLVLKDILANKQSRGAFGQGRMEAIIRDGLPASAYEFQLTLANGKRPDCALFLPGDKRPLVIDAKFPLEGFVAVKDATSEEARLAAERRVRTDIGIHIRDISEKYLLSGETQDIAMLFVPSEALYAELCEKFEDIVQKAHKARVVIVSPSLLMMAIQVCQTIVRDAHMRDQAQTIQKEVGALLDDVRRLQERSVKLENHFRQAQEDVAQMSISATKVARRGERIGALEFEDAPARPVSEPGFVGHQRAAE
ncbi:MAG: DNA recombination protein RmuC [Beijerinckiaceae bacterium]|nr:DNA recombination protein RmuC [Beijerinckiaceae bacterium]